MKILSFQFPLEFHYIKIQLNSFNNFEINSLNNFGINYFEERAVCTNKDRMEDIFSFYW